MSPNYEFSTLKNSGVSSLQISLLLKVNFLTFNENNGISAFSKKALTAVRITSPYSLKSTAFRKLSGKKTKGKLVIKSAFAGVGNPIKELVCRVSMLNFANR